MRVSDRVTTPTDRELGLQKENGLRVGGFVVQPSLSVEENYNDNIFGVKADPTDDLITRVIPRISIRSVLANEKLNANVYFSQRFYALNPGQDGHEYGGNLNGQVTVTRDLTLGISGVAQTVIEDRTNADSNRLTTDPIQYDNLEGRVSLSYDTSVFFSTTTARVRRVLYNDALIDGVLTDQSYRNVTISRFSERTGYKLGRLTDLFANIELEERRYDVRPGDPLYDPATDTDRGGTGLRAELGVDRELTPIASTTVRIGYLKFDYRDPRLKDVGKFSYYADLRWSLSPLTLLAVSGSRSIDETTSPTTAGSVRDEMKLKIDHELLRTVFLRADLRYAFVAPVGTAAKSRELEATLEARYYVGRRFRFTLGYTRKSRLSDDQYAAFKQNTVSLGFAALP